MFHIKPIKRLLLFNYFFNHGLGEWFIYSCVYVFQLTWSWRWRAALTFHSVPHLNCVQRSRNENQAFILTAPADVLVLLRVLQLSHRCSAERRVEQSSAERILTETMSAWKTVSTSKKHPPQPCLLLLSPAFSFCASTPAPVSSFC